MIHFVGAQYRNAYRACIRTISAWQLLLRDSVCMCAKVYLYHFRDLCITYGNKRSFLCTYFFLAVMITSASFCACEKLFVHIKEAWLKNFGVPFFWILKFSRLLHVHSVRCVVTQWFVVLYIAIPKLPSYQYNQLLNYIASRKKNNCHHDSMIDKIANV